MNSPVCERGDSRASVPARWNRGHVARARAQLAREALAECHLCEHHCGVNRLNGERGLCRAGPQARVFSAQVEVADELELIPTFAIALSGCDLRCDFCITGAESWNPLAGESFSVAELAARAEAALANGACTVMILGGEPTVHLPTALDIVSALPGDGRVVWKTNAHGSAQARALLDGLFDVWLADYKFGNDTCASRLTKVPDYTRIVRENLRWMYAQGTGTGAVRTAKDDGCGFSTMDVSYPLTPALSLGERENRRLRIGETGVDRLVEGLDGIPPLPKGEGWGEGKEDCLQPYDKGNTQTLLRSKLIVRHLLLPGHVDCCWSAIAEWLAAELSGVKVNLRSGFWPAWHAARHSELDGTVSSDDYKHALDIARDFGLNLVQ